MLVDRMEALKKYSQKRACWLPPIVRTSRLSAKIPNAKKQQYGEDLDISFHPADTWWKPVTILRHWPYNWQKETGARLHILHISTARELGLLEDRPLHEKKITAEACVSHLMFCDEDYAIQGHASNVTPASRQRPTVMRWERLWLPTWLTSLLPTMPPPVEWKEGGALKAVSGMPTLQFSLVSIYELVHEGILSIEQLVQKMCHAPAQLYQISQRGFIRPGYQADLVLLNPHKEWTVTTDCIENKCGWSPMEEGRTFHAQVEKTFVNGTAVYENGKVNKAHRGQALRFER